jgi:cellulose synthase/poly-beta-1,6-N-acetylglucosamine synthase-like glycosyltransferase
MVLSLGLAPLATSRSATIGRRAVLTAPAVALVGVLAAIDLYRLALLVAASRADASPAAPPPGEPLRFVVLVPAHDEEASIGATLTALVTLDYPRDRREIVVVADNCSDRTAEIARAAGVTVLERVDVGQRGKGHALNWALEQLSTFGDADAVAFVDADCVPTPNLLRAADARMRAGAAALQTDYVVANPEASTTSALRYAGFVLMNRVRALGRCQLGLSAGLVGTGMVFRRRVIEQLRFDPASLIEDAELHLRLVEMGERVDFVPEAAVASAMPTTAANATAQVRRWEGGRVNLWRRWLRAAVSPRTVRRNAVLSATILDEAIPPQALLGVLHVAGTGLALASGRGTLRRFAAVEAGAQAVFVLGGLMLTRAPRAVYRALFAAPLLMAQKIGLFAHLAVRGAPTEWERTARLEPSVAGRAGDRT